MYPAFGRGRPTAMGTGEPPSLGNNSTRDPLDGPLGAKFKFSRAKKDEVYRMPLHSAVHCRACLCRDSDGPCCAD